MKIALTTAQFVVSPKYYSRKLKKKKKKAYCTRDLKVQRSHLLVPT